MSLDLSEPLRTAIIGEIAITGSLAVFANAPAVFTRRPVPSEATFPMICVSPDIMISDADGLSSLRPVVTRDVTVYGQQDSAYRLVEDVGYLLRELFHRRKQSISVVGYHVVDIVASGPRPAPVDDDKLVGRVVTLTVRLQKTS